MDCIDLGFRTRDDWMAFFKQARPRLEAARDLALERITTEGFHDPYLGAVPPDRIEINPRNLRESLTAHWCTSRTRAVLHVLRGYACARENSLRLFASERRSPFAERLRTTFAHFTGSEFLPLPSDRRSHPRVMHQDVQALSFSDNSFDVYVSCEVLEHVPDLDKALNEAARILRPGGLFVGTVPFNMNSADRIVRARLGAEGVEHLMEPEYHGNPTRPDEGSLVFTVPGWDFVTSLNKAGFVEAGMRFVMSGFHGVLSNHAGGVFVFCARMPASSSR